MLEAVSHSLCSDLVLLLIAISSGQCYRGCRHANTPYTGDKMRTGQTGPSALVDHALVKLMAESA